MNVNRTEIIRLINEFKNENFDFELTNDINQNTVVKFYWQKKYICLMVFRKLNQIQYKEIQIPIELDDKYSDEYIDYNVLYSGVKQVYEKMNILKDFI